MILYNCGVDITYLYLSRYFAEVLQNGPLAVDDPRIQAELEVFPFEATDRIKQVGGLGDFLKQSLKFAVIDDVLSLMGHAKKAREIALERRREKGSSGLEPVVNDWKTVGKCVNNSDGLIESLTTTSVPKYSAKVANVSSVLSGPKMTVDRPSSGDFSSVLNAASRPGYPAIMNNPATTQWPGTSSYSNWSEGVDSFDVNPFNSSANKSSMGLDTLDSIDDFPSEPMKHSKTSSTYDELDDIDVISDSYSEQTSQDSSSISRNISKTENKLLFDRLDPDISRCSSKSDLSEKSEKSGLSTDKPKPLKPLNIGFGGFKKPGVLDSKPEPVQDLWKAAEGSSPGDKTPDSVAMEMQKAGEEFVRKTDQEFVAELAESVVEKMCEGKRFTAEERSDMLRRVSSDIALDFERNEQLRKQGSGGLWANTPVENDYRNMNQLTVDFMKKHYDNSPASSFLPPNSNGNFSSSNKEESSNGFSSMLGITMRPNSVSQASNQTGTSSGYNLFSGPTFGAFNSFPTTTIRPSVPIAPPSITSSQQFVRPPLPAMGFYGNGPIPRMPGAPPMFPGIRPPASYVVSRQEMAIQASPMMVNRAVMTDAYEPSQVAEVGYF